LLTLQSGQIVASILCLVIGLSSGTAPNNRTLRGATVAVAHLLQLGDWASFRRVGCPNILVAEYWTAYASYFDKKEGFGGNPSKGVLGQHEFGYVGGMSALPNRPALNPAERKLFRAFGRLMRESRAFAGTKWPDWPEVQESGVERFESAAILGPCASFKVVSNIHLGIEFDKVAGRYLVKRLSVIGH